MDSPLSSEGLGRTLRYLGTELRLNACERENQVTDFLGDRGGGPGGGGGSPPPLIPDRPVGPCGAVSG